MSPPKIVRCWSCKHLKTVHQGEPKEGKLFAEEFKHCDVHGTMFETYSEIVRERKCSHHIRVGLWESPPDARYPV